MKWDDLTPAQRKALRHPCHFAIETAHPRFAHLRPYGSLIVSVNTGYE